MTAADRDSRRRRLFGALAAVVYAAVWLLLILFVHFRLKPPQEMSEGILVEFGASETGLGDIDPTVSDQAADPAAAASGDSPEDVLTQDVDPAPAVAPRDNPRPTQQPTPDPPRQPNRQALFPGRTPGSTSTSQGATEGTGNQGDPTGTNAGTGTGDSGNRASLEGRSLVGSLPKPDYPVREEGRVVIEIHVDQQGKVTRAAFLSRGSTTTNAALVAAAQRAATQARFNVDETAPFPQRGTITYNFRIE